jgi:hypothetical protein
MGLESTAYKASRYNWVLADVIYTFSINWLAEYASYFQYFIASILYLLNFTLTSEVYVNIPHILHFGFKCCITLVADLELSLS